MARLYSIDTDGNPARIESDFSEEATSAAHPVYHIRLVLYSVSGPGGFGYRRLNSFKISDDAGGPFVNGADHFEAIEPSGTLSNPFFNEDFSFSTGGGPANRKVFEARYVGPLDLSEVYIEIVHSGGGNTGSHLRGEVLVTDALGGVVRHRSFVSTETSSSVTTVVNVDLPPYETLAYATGFSDVTLSDFTAQYLPSAPWALSDEGSDDLVQITTTSSARAALTKNGQSFQNARVRCRIKSTGLPSVNALAAGLLARVAAGSTSDAAHGVGLILHRAFNERRFSIQLYQSGSTSQPDTQVSAWTDDTWYEVEVYLDGSTVIARAWPSSSDRTYAYVLVADVGTVTAAGLVGPLAFQTGVTSKWDDLAIYVED